MGEYIIPAAGLIIVAIIEAIAARERRSAKEEREKAEKLAAKEKTKQEEHERGREELMVMLIQASWASIALGEATAHALQRGHTNGDMEKALAYAEKVKHEQKETLAKQGVHAIMD